MPTTTKYKVTAADVKGPFTRNLPDDMIEQAKLPALDYTSPLERLAERFHAAPSLLAPPFRRGGGLARRTQGRPGRLRRQGRLDLRLG